MQALIEAVQHNCDIVDARHGSDYGICTYLLKMRELYRWECGLPLGARLEKDEVGDWLTARESHLGALEQAEFSATIAKFTAEIWLTTPLIPRSVRLCIAVRMHDLSLRSLRVRFALGDIDLLGHIR